MENKKDSLFDSELGQRIFRLAESAIRDFNMEPMLKKGVLIGLSGGADSVLLLRFLLEYSKKKIEFPILVVHVNHMIRGAEADRDESFSHDLCRSLDVEFISAKVDVPKYASEHRIGIEEAARNVRYSEFGRILSGRNDISNISVAHNATDNLETVLFNILRGAGTRGASGIAPVRDNVLRPLIYVPKEDILRLLDEAGVTYVTDSSNLSTEYSRNYIRNDVIPLLRKIAVCPENSAMRLSANLRRDDEYICSVADGFLEANKQITNCSLASLHFSVFSRVIKALARRVGCSVEEVHVQKIYELLEKNDFKYSLPAGCSFVCERGICTLVNTAEVRDYEIYGLISRGVNSFDDYDADILLSDTKFDVSSLNVYKISIQANLDSAIIRGGLFVRSKRDGDTIFYGGHRHKLKKIFSDLKIPTSLRKSIPILCDDSGVVWVPGVAVREDGVSATDTAIGGKTYIALGIGKKSALSEYRLRSASEFRI